MKAIIFAAGLGTRLKGETKNRPKALVEIGGKPLLQLAVEKLRDENFNEIVVNIHHFSELMTGFLKSHDFGIAVQISDESDKLLDTGGALKKAAPLLRGEEPVLVYNVDILSNLNLRKVMDVHIKSRALATLVIRERNSDRCFKFDDNNRLAGWINKRTGQKKISDPAKFDNAKEMAFSGIHVVSPAIFEMMPDEDVFSVIDLYTELAKNHLIKGYVDKSDLWIDTGTPEKLEEARRLTAKT
ncbi:MAG: nucleotidyltransferase family protein [Prolixibacteraceae bacterium]|nr:nucleotidyltransferase family protein [Prolixibacteraceae bacterium]